MGALQKIGKFIGIDKFGKAIATAGREVTGGINRDIQVQDQITQNETRLLYAAKQEQNPEKRKQLLQLAQSVGQSRTNLSEIDPGLKLTNKEVIGSAANLALNVAGPAAFKGSKAAIIGKNAAQGALYGAASGLEKNRDTKGIIGSTAGGAIIGAGIGVASVAAKAFRDFTTKTTPEWLMNKAVKPTLDELRKNVKYGTKTLGKELLDEGVSGGPQKLLDIAETRMTEAEDKLQNVLKSYPGVSISKEQIVPYLQDAIKQKQGVPGLGGDVQRIKNIINDIPDQLTLQEANEMKRRIYNELRDPAYKLDAKLGTKAGALKQIAKGLKTEIENAVGGDVVAELNRKLSIYGRLEGRITDQMARTLRNNAFGLTDAILTAGGVANMTPQGLLAAMSTVGIKKGAGSTAFRTGAAQVLKKGAKIGTGATARAAKDIAKRAALNLP